MDLLESEITLCQLVTEPEIRTQLGDILRLARALMRCDVLDEPVPEGKLCGLDEQQLIDKLENRISKNMNDNTRSFKDDEEWMMQLVSANPHLPMCQEILGMDNIHNQSLFLLIVAD